MKKLTRKPTYYGSFGTDSADFLLDAENEKAIEVDKNISDAKKRFRKANLKD